MRSAIDHSHMFRASRDATAATAIWRTILIVLAVVAPASLAAQSASSSHDVRIVIPPIRLLEVDQAWEISAVRTVSETDVISASTTYGATCTLRQSAIVATLVEQLPQGVQARMRMASGIGVGSGWTELRHGHLAILVRNPRGNEFNVIEMELTVPIGTAPASVPVNVAFSLEGGDG